MYEQLQTLVDEFGGKAAMKESLDLYHGELHHKI
jgi:hypothetical protein